MFDVARRNLPQRKNPAFTQDVIVCGLCLPLFGAVGIKLVDLVRSLLGASDFSSVIGKILFVVVLLEIFRLLLLYLDEDRVSVATIMELGAVGMLCEVILRSALHIGSPQLLVVFVFTLGAVLCFSGSRRYANGGKPGEGRTIRPGARLVRPTAMPARGIRAKQI